mgnify:CR=1 FL=1
MSILIFSPVQIIMTHPLALSDNVMEELIFSMTRIFPLSMLVFVKLYTSFTEHLPFRSKGVTKFLGTLKNSRFVSSTF